MALTAKQARFVEEYLIDLNATQAAIRAGYSQKTARSVGHENLTKPDIEAAIQTQRDKISERAEIDASLVLMELAKIAFANLQDFVQIENGKAVLDISKLTREQTAALSEVIVEEDKVKFKLHDKRMALVDIGRHLGMFSNKVNHTRQGQGGGPIRTITDKMTLQEASEAWQATRLNFG